MNCVVLLAERACPAVEHIGDQRASGDAKSEVQVGKAIAAAQSERADDGSDDNALILLRQSKHAIAERISLLNGKPDARSSRCGVENCSRWPGESFLDIPVENSTTPDTPHGLKPDGFSVRPRRRPRECP